MAIDQESFNTDLYKLLRTRGYKPVPKDVKNQRSQPEAAEVFNFTFMKDGKEYGDAWVTIDNASNVVLYYSNEQEESPSGKSPGLDYDDSWSGLKRHLKQWSMNKQLTFELRNKDELGDDMAQRDYVKKKEKMNEAYHPMGKKASYNDNIPAVKIILQHNRQIEEGEQRYRNIAKIFLENQDGERFLAPTTRPGIAQVYARHIAEGGVPNDERWNHIKSLCEEYSKMAGFVRATKNKQFNESAQSLVNEGINHYQSLRETLGKLRGHRGYNQYFESWTPALMEDDTDSNKINELFVQETVDPRIESVMPILSRLYKKTGETPVKEVKELEQWADSIVEGEETLKEGSDPSPVESAILNRIAMVRTDLLKYGIDKVTDAVKEVADYVGDVDEIGSSDVSGWIRQVEGILGHKEIDEDINDSGEMKTWRVWIMNNYYNGKYPDYSARPYTVVASSKEEARKVVLDNADEVLKDLLSRRFPSSGGIGTGRRILPPKSALPITADRIGQIEDGTIKGKLTTAKPKMFFTPTGKQEFMVDGGLIVGTETNEGLDKNQKKAGQLGPTEKIGPKGTVDKLVGVSESVGVEEGTPEHEVIMDLINGNLDAYDVMNHPRTPAQQKVAAMMQERYDDIAGSQGFYDDDFEKILNKIVDELADDYDTSGYAQAMSEGQEDLDLIKRLIK